MFERFEEVFWAVADEQGYTVWYELYDSENFAQVEARITEMLGYDCWHSEDFRLWCHEMDEEL